jgi:hypothetical protein
MVVGYRGGVNMSVTAAGDGNQFLLINSLCSAAQQLDGLQPGNSYHLSFKMAAEAESIGPQTITVSFPGGSPTSSESFTSYPAKLRYIGNTPVQDLWSNWGSESMVFVASSSSVTLRFSTPGGFSVGLDSVDVKAVPELSTLSLIAGIILLATPPLLIRMRRRPPRSSPR